MKKKPGRDFAIIYKINEHFNDLKEDFSKVDSYESFVNLKELRRAILFDFLQIGELTNQLSQRFLKAFNNKNAYDLISIRNRIVHGYSSIRDDIVYSTLKNDISKFIDELNVFSREYSYSNLKKLIGKKITVTIDRPIGYNHNDVIYPINYGYYEKLTALDGEFQDAYILGVDEPISSFEGTVVAIIHRFNDVEDKLVVTKNRTKNSIKEEIIKNVEFREKYYDYEIIETK